MSHSDTRWNSQVRPARLSSAHEFIAKQKEIGMPRLIASVLLMVSFFVGASQSEAGNLRIAAVTASAEQVPNVATNTLDGDLGTRWSAKGDGQWIRYELESCEVVFGVRIAWFQGDSRVASFAIETSEDGVSWVTVSQADSSGEELGLQSVNTADQFACFVRIVGFGTSVNAWNSITEVNIEGFVGEHAPVGGTGVLIPIARAYASAEDRSNVAANTLDGDFNTRWSARADRWIADDIEEDQGWDPQPEDRTTWISFELERCQAIEGVHIAWYQGDRRVSFFGVELSEDGVNWKRTHFGVGFGSSDPGESHYVSLDLPSHCFLRIVGFGNTFNAWNSITEVRIEGELTEDELRLMN